MNTPNRATDVPKSPLDRLSEVFNALLIIKDLVALVQKGAYYHLIPIYGQLRALLTDKTQRGANKPLFLEVLGNLSPEAKMYCIDHFNETVPGDESQPFAVDASALLMSVERNFPNQIEVSIIELLDKDVLSIGGRRLSLRDFINTYSDKFGGSHYDGAIPQHIFDLHSFGLGSPNFIALHFAQTLVHFGAKMLSEICNFEIILDIFFKEKKPGRHIIYDLFTSTTQHRVSVHVNGNDLEVVLIDFFGTKIENIFKDVLANNSDFLIDITYEITHEFEALLSVRINSSAIYQKVINPPLLTNNLLRGYERYINRGKDIEYQDFEFGMYSLLLPNKVLSSNDRIMMELEIESRHKRSKKSFWYGSGGFGYSASDEGDIHNTGNVSLGVH
jgi:hypothetical protein